MTKQSLTQERLKELLNYNPETGVFTRAITSGRCDRWKKGSIAGTPQNGYICIRVDDRKFQAHRLAWLYVFGHFPCGQVDHINHVRDDNRICNLRSVTHQENSRNASKFSTNTSGIVGVSWSKERSKWASYIIVNRKKLNLGCFTCLDEATKARKNAELKYGFHKNHGV